MNNGILLIFCPLPFRLVQMYRLVFTRRDKQPTLLVYHHRPVFNEDHAIFSCNTVKYGRKSEIEEYPFHYCLFLIALVGNGRIGVEIIF